LPFAVFACNLPPPHAHGLFDQGDSHDRSCRYCAYAAAYAAILESIPRHLRARIFALVYSIPVALFGGTTQLVITWLLHATGSSMSIAWYLFAISLIGCGAMLAMPETAPLKLRLARSAIGPLAQPA
jgi:MFS family permease